MGKETPFYCIINPYMPNEYQAMIWTSSYIRRECIKEFLNNYNHLPNWNSAKKQGYICQKSIVKPFKK